MFHAGTITVAVLVGDECYESIKMAFGDVIIEINSVIDEGHVELENGKKIPVEIFLGGDYKVRRIL